jgi:hypothetical protein
MQSQGQGKEIRPPKMEAFHGPKNACLTVSQSFKVLNILSCYFPQEDTSLQLQ